MDFDNVVLRDQFYFIQKVFNDDDDFPVVFFSNFILID